MKVTHHFVDPDSENMDGIYYFDNNHLGFHSDKRLVVTFMGKAVPYIQEYEDEVSLYDETIGVTQPMSQMQKLTWQNVMKG